MPTITFTIGLCGSGKTHYSDELKKKTGAIQFEGIGRGIVNNKYWPGIICLLNTGLDCIIEEMYFCSQRPRDEVVSYIIANAPDTKIKWVCFENDLESANWNVIKRTNKGAIEGHLQINQDLHLCYEYQPNVNIIPIKRIVI